MAKRTNTPSGLSKALEANRTSLSIEELDKTIGRLEGELGILKRIRRAKTAGLASAGRPRKRRVSYDQVRALYREGRDARQKRVCEQIAEDLHVSVRQVYRITRDFR